MLDFQAHLQTDFQRPFLKILGHEAFRHFQMRKAIFIVISENGIEAHTLDADQSARRLSSFRLRCDDFSDENRGARRTLALLRQGVSDPIHFAQHLLSLRDRSVGQGSRRALLYREFIFDCR
jgi:hypothetical protein